MPTASPALGRLLRRKPRSLLLALLALTGFAQGRAPEPSTGLVIEGIQQGTTADKAGLAPGDVIVAWATESGASGTLHTPFDLATIFVEEVPRQTVTLEGMRGGEPRTWQLPALAPSNFEEVTARPVLPPDLLALYSQGKERLAAGDLEGGLEPWRTAATRAREAGDEGLSLWFSVQEARALGKAERWQKADPLYQQLIAPLENRMDAIAPQLLREWGATFKRRRVWDLAADSYRRALALDRRLARESLAEAASLVGLGQVASLDAGPRDPETFFRQALRLREKLAPGSSDVAATWAAWGLHAVDHQDWVQATARFQRAVRIQEKATPQSIDLAEALMRNGMAEYFQDHFEASEALWRQAFLLAEREAPRSRITMGILQGLGNVATKRGRLAEAEERLRRALALGEQIEPYGIGQADMLHDLGLVEGRLGESDASAEHLCRALEVLERQQRFQAEAANQLRWGFFFADNYRDCADALFMISQPEKAFQTLERGRARSFLKQLTERDVRPSGLPADKAELWRQLGLAYDTVQSEMEQIRTREPGRLPALEGKLREIQQQKKRILRENLPAQELRYPLPLDLAETRRALDSGTALVTYSTAGSRTLLFVVRPANAGEPGMMVFPIEEGTSRLRKRVRDFRYAILKRRSRTSREQGKALYELLLRPADSLLAGSQRILLIPDGALHTLPFAALVRDGNYLIQWKPLHFALSATAYAELKKQRRPKVDPSNLKLVAFGDPRYRRYTGAEVRKVDLALRTVLRREFSPLPDSRREVRSISHLFPRSEIFVGGDATEQRAKAVGKEVRFLHFAAHGWLDEHNPANSALVLSLPPPAAISGSGNGLLQAWEIMEDLHLDADLVTLSACDTALGTETGGDGLISLTRAFQYAGARSVVATLWGIVDQSTAPLMREFYQQITTGKSKDEALRIAQIQQIRAATRRGPFGWAAFQLYGDWD